MTTGLPSVACIIPTKDRPDLAHEVIQRLARQTCEPTVIVVVDASAPANFDRLAALSAKLHEAHVVHVRAHTASITAQRNQGIEVALEHPTWDYIQFMDDDVAFDKDLLLTAATAMQRNDLGGLCGATISARARADASLFERVFALTPAEPGRISGTGRNAGYAHDNGQSEPLASEWLLGCSMYRRDVVQDHKFWVQPGYVLFEDAEFSSRVARAGTSIAWLPSLRLDHLELSRSEPDHRRTGYQMVYNRAKLISSSTGHSPTPVFWWSVLGLLGRAAAGSALRRRGSQQRLAGLWQGARAVVSHPDLP